MTRRAIRFPFEQFRDGATKPLTTVSRIKSGLENTYIALIHNKFGLDHQPNILFIIRRSTIASI